MSYTKKSEEKNRVALLVQYDGSHFNGWQIQNKGRTVQGEIEKALEVLLKEKIRTTAAGRTDSGVHALGQVIHFDFSKDSSDISLKKLCISLNGILEKDVAVKNAFTVPQSFHARFSAVQREYLYIVYNHPQRNPFVIKRAMWVSYDLDMNFLQNISHYFIGEKDFASFCKKESTEENTKNTVRRIDEFEVTKKEEFIFFRIKGTAFLHNMVRIIIGTILDIYNEKKSPDYVLEILEQKDRNASGRTAPAYGLYLNQIIYDPPLSAMKSAY
jgi:tRNA pseudouridine38-40 synthase